ncbi:acetyl-CoA acetyl transferase [Stereum hirsutum FP-91666 SS1]|uniref:acetyl-CoA acetyl transferase n=1 Tax=Stereum hirsutum (strain FP-91666) TaxID=721885 RepID=UPI000440B286|nr:acetyl-CoA acetyl transferase [Stereum hirsutum FP-91666 SS1]EIM86377.1 acetyl-CoA acetyl transferase [Stereum hirsutum FP-91666 SS1]
MSSITERITQFVSPTGKGAALAKNDNDVVIVSAVRTAMTKARKGGFKSTHPEELLSAVLRASYTTALPKPLDPALIQDISVGNVLPAGGGATAARMAALHAGIPIGTPIATVNRQCSSGLTAVNQIAGQIATGQIDIGIGAGVESMTFGYGPAAQPASYSSEVLSHPAAEDCLIPMGITSENVAKEYGISREAQDKFAARSFQKAAEAQKAGKFKDEIIPVSVKIGDDENAKTVIVDADDGVRAGVTAESLGKLRPAFDENGSTHAGNASQVSDGAAAVLLARRSVAKQLGLPILGKFVGAQVVGVPPHIMGVGPAFAIPKVLEKTGLSKDDVDFFEINEAFASQAIYSIDTVGIPYEKVNVNGGAIAMGHPLGCTGARQIATGLNIAKQTGGKIFVTSMCIGSGMGMAAVFTSEQ